MGGCLTGCDAVPTFGNCIPIFFGSHAGTAERLAHMLHDAARARKIRTQVVNLANFAEYFLAEDRAPRLACNVGIFVVSTRENGAPTVNAQEFVGWMQSCSAADYPLKDLHFALYAIGNSKFGDAYCAVGSTIEKELQRLGAEIIGNCGRGDTNDLAVEDHFETWYRDTWETLQPYCPPEACGIEDLAVEVPTLIEQDSAVKSSLNEHQVPDNIISQWYFSSQDVNLVSVKALPNAENAAQVPKMENEVKQTVLITLEVPSNCDVTENMLANICEIRPDNDPDLVERLAGIFGWKLSNHIAWTSRMALFPTPCTVETALTRYCDILSLPPRQTMQDILQESPNAHAVCEIVHSTVYDSLRDAHISWIEFAEEFLQGYSLPLELFLIKCHRMKPRAYSVCSTYLEDESRFQILVNQQKIDLPSAPSCMPKLKERMREGKASWLIQHPKTVSIALLESTFLLPSNPSYPILLIGAGIAIAPLLGFIRHFMKMALFDRPQNCLLFFGCMHPDEDFFCKDELAEAQANWDGLDIITAFSREHDRKVYVQHRLLQNQLKVSANIDDGGSVYVSGGVDLCQEVHEALDEILAVQKVNATVDMLMEQGRYMTQPWI